MATATSRHGSPTRRHGSGKQVTFELILPESPQKRARLPMRVFIFPHDTTDSIISTTKNFYGLYEPKGVSFEDRQANTLIAAYDNFEHGMTVYVRIMDEDDTQDEANPASPKRPRLEPPIQMLPPQLQGHPIPRPSSRSARSTTSNGTNPKSRSRPPMRSRGSGSQGPGEHPDMVEYSDSDGGNGSVTSSRRGRSEQVASAEISVENIVEGGRRKIPKFDSSELPLFVPSQVPMAPSASSLSPQRRIEGNMASPYQSAHQATFAWGHPLPSPQSYGPSDRAYIQVRPIQANGQHNGTYARNLRQRPQVQYAPGRQHNGHGGVLATPDPTVGGSVISDEDVALQLMRLGEYSSHGRTSTSTLDDAQSGKAVVSSDDESMDGSDNEHMGVGYNSAGSSVEYSADEGVAPNAYVKPKGKPRSSRPSKPRSTRPSISHNGPPVPKAKHHRHSTSAAPPISPPVAPGPDQLAAPPTHPAQPLGPDEEDLSSKPRCQRCRKSKKGCDRQRPCGRCKDAGIGIEGCLSEDEGNGRRGRYGRHMGVPVKKGSVEDLDTASRELPAVAGATVAAGPMIEAVAMSVMTVDGFGGAGKKRKR
ncbi:hypothetical protein P152DRAFT_405703 [Eremomyces bilateralis CBS 781.70]|uniref:Zn(2)-C6 fungal-type domain-containing protein n=1 Tax=Eremomyces bilateralis CBS 781.70 TaxID=1392243 RepID=A0A6G1FRC2_9PEZI|nr:uncharacterized protein P152DRAFT_405703 [Eremomyces bilateralis CBS 781.70]KAF1808323.1 hypothetical protein P152DRAFT_405703 [Eremomyces bilateralis CBS 781.70]